MFSQHISLPREAERNARPDGGLSLVFLFVSVDKQRASYPEPSGYPVPHTAQYSPLERRPEHYSDSRVSILLETPNVYSLTIGGRLFHLSSLQAHNVINYTVPNTPTTLRFFLGTTTIEAPDMARTILQTQVTLRRYIKDHYQAAQDVLFPSDDPYMSDLDLSGCFLAVTHWPEDRPKHLTYGMVDNVLRGVWEFMYRGGRLVEVNFEVFDEQLGLVGAGYMERGFPDLDMKNITQG